MNALNRIKELMKIKKEKLKDSSDIEKYELIEELFKDNQWFLKIDIKNTISILEFLGVGEDEIEDLYYDLISMDNYNSVVPKERGILNEETNNQNNVLK